METGAGSDDDLLAQLDVLLPRDDRWRHRHGSPATAATTSLPAFIPPHASVPVLEGRLQLGTWQRICLVDTNTDNQQRHVRFSFLRRLTPGAVATRFRRRCARQDAGHDRDRRQTPPSASPPATRRRTSRCPTPRAAPVSLADHRGRRVIVYCYPAALTPGCTTQAVDFTAAAGDLAEAGLDIIGISPDAAGEAAAVPRARRSSASRWCPTRTRGAAGLRRVRPEEAVRQGGRRRDPLDLHHRRRGPDRDAPPTTSRRPGTWPSSAATSASTEARTAMAHPAIPPPWSELSRPQAAG